VLAEHDADDYPAAVGNALYQTAVTTATHSTHHHHIHWFKTANKLLHIQQEAKLSLG